MSSLRSILTNVRLHSTPLATQAVYLRLHHNRAEIADALTALSPESTIATIVRCSYDEAAQHLETMRTAGLVSAEGLDLLLGAPRTGRIAGGGAPTEADGANLGVRTRFAAAHAAGWSYRDAARAVGCSETLLRNFASRGKNLGSATLAALSRELDVRTEPGANQGANQVCEPGSQWVRTESGSPSLSPSEIQNQNKTTTTTTGTREAEGKGDASEGALALTAPTAETAAAKGTKRTSKRTPRPAPTPAPDVVPELGTLARELYDAITADPFAAPIVVRPGATASKLADPKIYPHINARAELVGLLGYLASPKGQARGYVDGDSYLTGNFKRKSDEAAKQIAPPPANTAPVRVSYSASPKRPVPMPGAAGDFGKANLDWAGSSAPQPARTTAPTSRKDAA